MNIVHQYVLIMDLFGAFDRTSQDFVGGDNIMSDNEYIHKHTQVCCIHTHHNKFCSFYYKMYMEIKIGIKHVKLFMKNFVSIVGNIKAKLGQVFKYVWPI